MERLKMEADEKRLMAAELTARYRDRVRLFVSDTQCQLYSGWFMSPWSSYVYVSTVLICDLFVIWLTCD